MTRARERELALQRRVFREYRRGPDPEEVALRAVAEAAPRDVLEVGPGDGAFAERLVRELGVGVLAVDVSPRMVELTRARGIEATVADVQALPFADERFDCAVANWMLYLAPDVDRAVAELARVLRRRGRLVAGTVAEAAFAEVRELLGDVEPSTYSLGAETGAEILRRHFARVERRYVEGTIVFPGWRALRDFIASGSRAHLAERVPRFAGSFSTRNALAIFVAEKD